MLLGDLGRRLGVVLGMTVEAPPNPKQTFPKIDPRVIVGNAAVRKICGGITRPTLIEWRENREFPKPVRTLPVTGDELWDANEVRAWLRANDRPIHRL